METYSRRENALCAGVPEEANSLNVRGLSNNSKSRETFLWLKTKKLSIYFYRKLTVQVILKPFGVLSRDTQLSSPPFPVQSWCWYTF